MVGEGMFSGLAAMLFCGFVAFALLILLGGYTVYDKVFADDCIKSKTIIIPEKRLTTDGKKVDTIYIYRK